MTYDVATRSVVLFGGGDLYGYLSDTWEWDSALWSQDSQIGLPTPRTDPGFAYDAPRHQVVMFGGQFCSEFGCNDLRDTWVWDGTRWTRVRPATSPPARNDPAMEYDPVHRVVVLFGGSGLSDTWTWDGTTWTHQTPATSPPGDSSEMAFDAATGLMVLFNSEGQTWTWNGTTWHRESPSASPSPRSQPMMSYDGPRHDVVLFGGFVGPNQFYGDTWTWDGSTWHQQSPSTSPPPRSDGGMATDPLHRNVVMFGGVNDCTITCSLLGDTWTWDGTTWTDANPPTVPPSRSRAAMAEDPVHPQDVLFGGEGVDGKAVGDTWTYDGTAWTKRTPATSPAARYGAVMAWDPVTQTDLLFGGCCDPNSATGYFRDTWSWDGSTWTELHPAHSPPGREDSAAATDFARHRVVLFAGCCIYGLNAFRDTWTWNGTDWVRRNPALPPSARKGHAMTWDPTGNRVLLFGGFNDQTPHSDQTWAWDGSQWTQLFPATTVPHERSYEGMATDEAGGDVVMFGGVGGLIGDLGDTWIWNGTDWSQRTSSSSPGPRESVAMAWDPGGNDVLLFGGCCGAKGDTWTWDGSAWTFHNL